MVNLLRKSCLISVPVAHFCRPNYELVFKVLHIKAFDEQTSTSPLFLFCLRLRFWMASHVDEVNGEPGAHFPICLTVHPNVLLNQECQHTPRAQINFFVQNGFETEEDHCVFVEELVELVFELVFALVILAAYLPDLMQNLH